MRRLFISSVTAAAIVLGGCSTTQVTDFLGQVQAAAAVACKFVPTIDTILSIAAALGFAPATAAAGAVTAVSSAICSQVPPPASAAYGRLPLKGVGPAVSVGKVGGVAVNGWRTP